MTIRVYELYEQVELGSPEPGDDTKVTILGGDGQLLTWKVRYHGKCFRKSTHFYCRRHWPHPLPHAS
jgi:hypothetical protein